MHRLEVHLQGWRAVHLYARLPKDFLPAIPISSAAHPNGCSLPRWRMERNRVSCVIVCVDASRESPVVRHKSCGQAQGQRAPLISGLLDVVRARRASEPIDIPYRPSPLPPHTCGAPRGALAGPPFRPHTARSRCVASVRRASVGAGGEYEIMGGDVRKSVSQSWRLQRPQRGHARATTCDRDRSGHTHARANLNNEKTCATSTPPESNTAPSAATRTAPLGQWAGEAAANQRVGPASI